MTVCSYNAEGVYHGGPDCMDEIQSVMSKVEDGSLCPADKARLMELLGKINPEQPEAVGREDPFLTCEEREEMAGLLKSMGASHLVRYRRTPWMPGGGIYSFHDLPRHAVQTIVESIASKQDRLKKFGVTGYMVGHHQPFQKVDSEGCACDASSQTERKPLNPGDYAVYFYVNKEVSFDPWDREAFWPDNMGPCATGVQRLRTPQSIESYPVVGDSTELVPLQQPPVFEI